MRNFERTIGHELPPDYRAFLLDVNVEDGGTMMLVPTDLHSQVAHTGGMAGTGTAPEASGMTTSWIPMTETGRRVTADDVRHYERELGHELPEDYRQFLVDVNGGQPSLERSDTGFTSTTAGQRV